MTERAEHTAGPWEFESDETSSGTMFTVYDKDGDRVSATYINEKSARLIAAAPDLLAACQEFVRKVECGEAKSTRSYEQMKAAIAKAIGGQS